MGRKGGKRERGSEEREEKGNVGAKKSGKSILCCCLHPIEFQWNENDGDSNCILFRVNSQQF